ncbi:hypothetical protein [Streptomyces sp. NPDC004783]|uniref:hypothetical protein n=1 Tax=Streptomyces sp. NPDC004783 TaxID=3154459 RepID=UPI0033A6881F
MFLVTPDRTYGLVAAPRAPEDLTPGTEEALTAQDFTWNSEIEAYTRPTGHGPEGVDRTASTLRGLGHFVLLSYTPAPVGRPQHPGRAGPRPLPPDRGDRP